jgi:hypothetical protein
MELPHMENGASAEDPGWEAPHDARHPDMYVLASCILRVFFCFVFLYDDNECF